MRYSLRTTFAAVAVIAASFAVGLLCSGALAAAAICVITAIVAFRTRQPWRILMGIVSYTCAALSAALLLIGLFQSSHPGAMRIQSRTALVNIALAVQNYDTAYDTGPFIAMSNHSWRTRIAKCDALLPSDSIRLNEQWDSPHNKRTIAQMPNLFKSLHDDQINTTGYVAIDFSRPFEFSVDDDCGQVLSTIKNRSNGRVCIVEVCDSGIPWTEPDDQEMRCTRERMLKGICNVVRLRGGVFVYYWNPRDKKVLEPRELDRETEFVERID